MLHILCNVYCSITRVAAGASGFNLYPIGAPAGTVGPILASRDDAFQSHGADMLEHRCVVAAFEVFGQPQAVGAVAKKPCQRRG
jgi:hypothetical protein